MNEHGPGGLPGGPVPHAGFDWPVDGVDPFDLGHDETVTFFWSHSRPTRGFVGRAPDVQSAEVHDAIPMGYVTLALFEKLAIVADGRECRSWPPSDLAGDPGGLQPYQLVLPPLGGTYLRLGAAWPGRYALADSLALSARTRGPVILCRVLSHVDWH